MGNYGWLSRNATTAGFLNRNPYTLGVYAGFEYQPKPYFQAFIKITPYMIEKNNMSLSVGQEYFEMGQIGMVFFWN